MDNLLTIIIFTPLLAALIMGLLLKGADEPAIQNARYLGLYGTLATVFVALFLLVEFDRTDPGFQFVEDHLWYFGLSYKVGVDGISALMILTTVFTMPFVMMSTWNITHRVKELMIGLLTMQTAVVAAFCALDVVLFFALVVTAVVVVVLVMGLWGRDDSAAASIKFGLYAVLGGGVFLIALVSVIRLGPGADVTDILIHNFGTPPVKVFGIDVPGGTQGVLLLLVLVGAAVLMGLWPYHAWTPQAFHQAPPLAIFLFTALIAKLGVYTVIRMGLPIFPVAWQGLQTFLYCVAGIGTVWAALVALVQSDMRRVLAYAFAAHMGVVMMGVFSATQQGLDGALLLVVSGGIVFGGLAVGLQCITDRGEDTTFANLGGLIQRMPVFVGFMTVLVWGLMMLPGSGPFAGVFLVVLGTTASGPAAAFAVIIALPILAAVGWGMFRRTMLGELMRGSLKALNGLSVREVLVLGALAAVSLVLGFVPWLILDFTDTTVSAIFDARAQAIAATD